MIECFFFGERLLLLCQLFIIIITHYYVDYSTLQLVKLLITDGIFASFFEKLIGNFGVRQNSTSSFRIYVKPIINLIIRLRHK